MSEYFMQNPVDPEDGDFDEKALLSDASRDFISPRQPAPYTTVHIRLRTGKYGVLRCVLVHCKKDGSDVRWERMQVLDADESFLYHSAAVQLDAAPMEYYFEIYTCGGDKLLYTRNGIQSSTDGVNSASRWRLVPGYQTPEWMEGAVTYQIYVDRFCNGDSSNDVLTDEYYYIGDRTIQIKDWGQYPQPNDIHEFYGGDLQGVIDKLPYLQELGVEVIYFNPLFVSPSNHKYDCQDYDHIDPHIGKILRDEGRLLEGSTQNKDATRYISRVTDPVNLEASNELFMQLVEKAHSLGIRVILDGVFNHCGSFNKWMDREGIYDKEKGYQKGAFQGEDSPYRNYFRFQGNGYEGWWGHDTLPKLDYEDSQELFDYIMKVGAKWVSAPYNADGWRLDVAADLGHSPEFNHQFWKAFRKSVKRANPNAIILAENYGDSQPWLQGDEWDTIMNYDAFMEPVTWFFTGMEKHSDDFRPEMIGDDGTFWRRMLYEGVPGLTSAPIYCSMNELSNHDHSRFLTRTNHCVGRSNTVGAAAADQNVNKAVFREAVVLQMTWMGAPTIYYGDEAGVCGFTDPDNRRTYPWGHEDQELIRFHQEIIKVHKDYECIRNGSFLRMYSAHNILAYARFNRDETIVVAINNGENAAEIEMPVKYAHVPKNSQMSLLFQTDEEGFERFPELTRTVPVQSGRLKVTVPATGALVFGISLPDGHDEAAVGKIEEAKD